MSGLVPGRGPMVWAVGKPSVRVGRMTSDPIPVKREDGWVAEKNIQKILQPFSEFRKGIFYWRSRP